MLLPQPLLLPHADAHNGCGGQQEGEEEEAKETEDVVAALSSSRFARAWTGPARDQQAGMVRASARRAFREDRGVGKHRGGPRPASALAASDRQAYGRR